MDNCDSCNIDTKKNTFDGSKTSCASIDSSNAIKAASAPIYLLPVPPEEVEVPELKTRISAPSYLLSLQKNEAPPFQKPGKEARPQILTKTIMNEFEAIEMIAAADADKVNDLKKWLGAFLVKKKLIHNYDISEKAFLVSLLSEVIDYAAQRDFTAAQLATMITIYLSTHMYFKWYYWNSPVAVWSYFKEVMIRHTIEDYPDGAEVFKPEECYDIMTHFHTVYLSNLPLVHIVTFGAHRLKIRWPFKLSK